MSNKALVGKIRSTKILNVKAVKDVIFKAWISYKGLHITELGKKCFLFSFNHEVEAKEVLQKSSMVHHELPNVSCFDIDFEKAPFWIKIHQLPLENINVASATLLLKKVGEVLEVENRIVESKILRPYIRGRVKIGLNKSLPAGCWVPRPGQANILVVYKYKRLQLGVSMRRVRTGHN